MTFYWAKPHIFRIYVLGSQSFRLSSPVFSWEFFWRFPWIVRFSSVNSIYEFNALYIDWKSWSIWSNTKKWMQISYNLNIIGRRNKTQITYIPPGVLLDLTDWNSATTSRSSCIPSSLSEQAKQNHKENKGDQTRKHARYDHAYYKKTSLNPYHHPHSPCRLHLRWSRKPGA